MMKNILTNLKTMTATVEFGLEPVFVCGLVTSLCLSLFVVSDDVKTRRYQTKLNGHRVVFKVREEIFHRFIVSSGTLTADWRRWQGFDCAASELT